MLVLDLVSFTLIVIAGVYFILLGAIAFIEPALAARFFLGFADNAKLHYLELTVRLAIGWALLHQSSFMLFAKWMEIIAWILLVTTACLFLLPWRWHRNFAQMVVPYANRYLTLMGIVSLVLGLGLLTSLRLFH